MRKNKGKRIKRTKRRFIAAKTTMFIATVGIIVLLASGKATDVGQFVAEQFATEAANVTMEGVQAHDFYRDQELLNDTELELIITPPTSEFVPDNELDLDLENEVKIEHELEPEPIPAPYERFRPYSLPETAPESFRNLAFANAIGGSTYPVHFGMPESYSTLGITTFRGNNFRNNATWGTLERSPSRLAIRYQQNVGSMSRRDTITCAAAGCAVVGCAEVHQINIVWQGVGWPGQPAIITWDFEVQQLMNIHPNMREREGLVEVIQSGLDGYIYFFELQTGQPTRPRLFFGETIKAGVSIDPRGYPLMFIGQGDQMRGERFGFYIYSLIDGSELFYLNGRDPFSMRWWGAFDGNPLVDSANDRLIVAGENGVVYSIELNTEFDKEAGTISIDPVLSRFRSTGSRRLGTENSPAAFSHYLFFADNSGIIICLDLKTMEPVWVFDAGDDTDASLVLDWEEAYERLVLYTGTQVDLQGHGGRAFIRKLNATNGEVLWEHSIPCHFNARVNGGVTATPVVGQYDISDLVIFWVAMVIDRGGGGALIAFDRQSGEIVWETILPNFGWSSPVAIYTEDGRSYLIVSDSIGDMRLIRGATGEVIYRLRLGGNVEASPVVFGNFIVVGTRGQRIFGIEIL
ncbi:MAG: PQQ-binding-like beta-propeller repeat protein [Oscillospiraceae bacterium]|nr:PQQ-binding-like beta-propeller repeat protein [Oscillospiraceae bacterium]